MSAEIVFQVDENGVETGKARLVLCKEGGWHGFGEVLQHITLEDCHRILGTDALVTVEKHYVRKPNPNFGLPLNPKDSCIVLDPNEFIYTEVEDSRQFMWKNGPLDVQLGTVGDQTGILQNKDFIDSLKPWLNDGLGEIESAGLLKGGKVIFAQIKVKDIEPSVIRTLKNGEPDVIQPYIGLSNGHGGKSMTGGRTDVRIVCANTLCAANRQMYENGSMLKKTHRSIATKNGKVEEAANELAAKMASIHKILLEEQKAFEAEVKALRFLAETKVKPLTSSATIEKTLWQYAAAVDKGKKATDVIKADYKPGRVELEIARLFSAGIGCEGSSWFDAHCAMTEFLSHGKANEMDGDRAGDAEARRHYDLWFGTRSSKLDTALEVALQMARAQV